MILSDKEILKRIGDERIVIKPFDRENLGSNSYDVHLSKHLAVYKSFALDAKEPNEIEQFDIPADGFILYPNVLYLGSTVEYTETRGAVPFLEGKSSMGRLGISIHATAGKGDAGFCNHWTLEISCIKPVKIYAGMPIGQLIYFDILGEVERPYNKKAGAKYNSITPRPVPSMMYKNFQKKAAKAAPNTEQIYPTLPRIEPSAGSLNRGKIARVCLKNSSTGLLLFILSCSEQGDIKLTNDYDMAYLFDADLAVQKFIGQPEYQVVISGSMLDKEVRESNKQTK